jgi:hypothetical protein
VVESLLFNLFKFLFALHGARTAFQALTLYLCLTRLDLAIGACVFDTREGICERFEVCDKLLVRPPSPLGLCGGLFDLGDEGRVLDLLFVLLGRCKGAVVEQVRPGECGCRACCTGGLCTRCCALLDWSLCKSALRPMIIHAVRRGRTMFAQLGSTS